MIRTSLSHLACLLTLTVAANAHATTHRVPSTYSTIQDGVNAASPGDTVLVEPGVYPDPVRVNQAIAVIAEHGPRFTILQYDPGSVVFVFERHAPADTLPRILQGFTFEGPFYQQAINIDTDSLVAYRIERCVFNGLAYPRTIQADGRNFSLTIRNNTFYGCGQVSSLLDAGCISSSNDSSAFMEVRNNVFLGNYRGLFAGAPNALISDYNCFFGNTQNFDSLAVPGDSDIYADPDIDLSNFRLAAGSPAIDAGDPVPAFNDPDGSRNDMGAFPYQPETLPVPQFLAAGPEISSHFVASLTPVISWSYFDTAVSVQSHAEVQVGTDPDWSIAERWSSGPLVQSDTQIVYAGSPLTDLETYFIRVRIATGGSWGSWRETFVKVHGTQVISVPSDYSTIQEAIEAAADTDTIAVSPGTYAEHLDFLGKEIVVRSTAGRDSTFLVPQTVQTPLVSLVSYEDSGAVFEGFSLRGLDDGDAILCVNSYPLIQDCDISYCHEQGRGGHGVFSDRGSPRILRNRIHYNASQGAGTGIVAQRTNSSRVCEIAYNDIYNNWNGAIFTKDAGNVRVHHNLIRGTFGDNRWSMWIDGNGSVSNRVYNNVVLDGARGLFVSQGNADSVFNNIIVSNVEEGISVVGFSFNNNVWNNGTGNNPGIDGISVDPLFTDPSSADFSLQPGSPCIDAGIADSAYNDTDGTRSDMGAGLASDSVHLPFWSCPWTLLRADVNGSGAVTSADIIFMVGYVFKSGPTPFFCAAAGDLDCTGTVTVGDIIHLINMIFGIPPVARASLKGGGDPPCDICRLLYNETWVCP